MNTPDTETRPWYRRYAFWILLGIAGYFLWMEHRAHVIAALPLLLLAGCIGIHFFMHGSHGHGAHGGTQKPKSDAQPRRAPSNEEKAEAERHKDVG